MREAELRRAHRLAEREAIDHGRKAYEVEGAHVTVTGAGNGPIAAFVHALKKDLAINIEIVDYAEHAITAGSDASAVAYVEARSEDGIRWGVGLDGSILAASLKAVLGAVNRLRGLQP